MSELFKNYEIKSAKIAPRNTHKCLPVEQEYYDEIYLGANIEHNFIVPHRMEEIEDIIIYYNQGTEIKLIKKSEDMNVHEYRYDNPFFCKMTYDVTAEDSLNFNAYNKEVYAQIKVFLKNGEIEYSDRYKIKIIDSSIKEVLLDGNNIEE